MFNEGATVKYDYKQEKGILIINVFDEVSEDSRQGGDRISNSYLYDIENDKILTAKEAIEKLELEDEYNELKSTLPGLTDNDLVIWLRNGKIEVVVSE